MPFATDTQTLNDLNLVGRHDDKAIYALFNRCITQGGASVLEEMFRSPLADPEAINRRSDVIKGFVHGDSRFPFRASLFEAVTAYLAQKDERSRLSAARMGLGKRIEQIFARDIETETIHKGIVALVDVLVMLRKFMEGLVPEHYVAYAPEREAILSLLGDPEFKPVFATGRRANFKEEAYIELDGLLRFRNPDRIEKLLHLVYRLDAYMAVAQVAKERGFTFARALTSTPLIIRMEGLYHPAVSGAVANTVGVEPPFNVVFLTGANMAGKSTLMKSITIAMYLAHMGFPVPATFMEFSVRDGIYTTINLPDNITGGASHFYSEVLRLKKVAQSLAQGQKLFILFDELFRGTNVKDAYEATLEVVRAFKARTDSVFLLSTHIVEVGETLRHEADNVMFIYLPTKMEGSKPLYTYVVERGITQDRHGMVIVRNEKILDILLENSKNHTGK